ncbi:16S rRNA (adenine(1518)-N(6)/adenine(1519)-N(6))-dimethyltransferase RsmA [Labedaea rhizosphaerae]|uniref:16S rRNA (adenine(1518)-N(6)/adenine(1519)-N(6))- dimethyltransferase RsmA n=1 Tax=Labedaea rhizosphaerae TaxID=598644 RepID=UPI00105E1B57|nr:16S rRNA (adenine(1518)-N(6)/adenine(1519)-N(6))-dimethyltransferase RsmA [Labedaea rhizosphaerae]
MSALLGPAEIRGLAERLGLRPTKKLGQNFVLDPNTVRRIVAAAGLRDDDRVIEVGPGLGSLTLALLPHCASLVAVELDPVLAEALPGTVSERAPVLATRLSVLAGDAMKVTRAELGDPTALVANLPYNVAVPVVIHLLAEVPTLRTGLVMVQAEVADRMAAAPGNKVYGVPSVKVAWHAEARRVATIGRNVFWPAPGVDSALVLLTRREPPQGVDRAAVFALVDAAFAQRRKTLRAALAGWAGSADRAEQVLRAAGIDPSTRGEQLSVRDFARIAQHAR